MLAIHVPRESITLGSPRPYFVSKSTIYSGIFSSGIFSDISEEAVSGITVIDPLKVLVRVLIGFS